MRDARTLVFLLVLAATSCGPHKPTVEPKPGPDDGKPDVKVQAEFLQTSPIPPEVMAAIEAQRQKVVPRPAPLGEITYEFPDVKQGKLENGLPWYLVHDPALPMVSLNLVVLAGTAHDPAQLPGLSVFTGDMLREGGTASRTSEKLSTDIETLGAELSIVTGADYTLLATDGLSGQADDLLGILAELATQPAFDEAELESFRVREKHRLALSLSDPEWVADKVLLAELYGNHPYSRYDTTEEALAKLTRDDVAGFHAGHYSASNSFFVAVGDMEADGLLAVLEKTLGKMAKGKPVKMQWPAIPERTGREIVIVDRPGSAQTVIRLGNVSLKGKDPDVVPFMVANHALGGNASSRLFMSLREDKGLTYGCYSSAAMRVDVGAFFVDTSTKTKSTTLSVQAILDEIASFMSADPGSGAVTEEELASYRNYLAGVLPIKAQTNASVADMLIDRMVYGLPADHYDTYAQKVQAVTPDVVRKIAKKYIHPDTALIVLVGDASAFEKQLSSLGTVKKVEP